MKVAIVKYNAGNVRSVENALLRLGVKPVVTDDADVLHEADRIIFPGQGEAATAMTYLHSHGLDEVIRGLRQPVLGVCIGMQLLCRHTEEGDTEGLGVFDAEVKRFVPKQHEDKVPQMGWNRMVPVDKGTDGLFQGCTGGGWVYFIHSYYVPVCNDTIATTDYILKYSAALHRGNFFATQFHPEKSGDVGELILRNFLGT